MKCRAGLRQLNESPSFRRSSPNISIRIETDHRRLTFANGVTLRVMMLLPPLSLSSFCRRCCAASGRGYSGSDALCESVPSPVPTPPPERASPYGRHRLVSVREAATVNVATSVKSDSLSHTRKRLELYGNDPVGSRFPEDDVGFPENFQPLGLPYGQRATTYVVHV